MPRSEAAGLRIGSLLCVRGEPVGVEYNIGFIRVGFHRCHSALSLGQTTGGYFLVANSNGFDCIVEGACEVSTVEQINRGKAKKNRAVIQKLQPPWLTRLEAMLVSAAAPFRALLTYLLCWTCFSGWAAVLMLLLSRPTDSCYLFPADKPDPCADLKCPPGAKCIATPDASSATCQCPTK